MKILVRLPNWLGDMVMSVGAMNSLPFFLPGAELSVIAKESLHELLDFFPPVRHRFIFNKSEHKGPKGLWQFGKKIAAAESFDLFVSLPDSFSAALMGYATDAKARIGYKKEGRNMLLTHAFVKPKNLHRSEEYARLLELFTGKEKKPPDVRLKHSFPKQDHLVININSEASSRRLTVPKAVEVISAVRKTCNRKIYLIGGPDEKEFVEAVVAAVENKAGIESLAGKTSLKDLAQTLASAELVLTTDSGPAHLANALGTQTVVLFGAGNENNTAPYNKEFLQALRLGKLSCEPCTKNVCVQFATPQCLELLDTQTIAAAVQQKLLSP